MNPVDEFKKQVSENIQALGHDKDVQALSRIWSRETNKLGYTYNFSWLGRPVIQYPQDLQAIQELIWEIKPDLIIETGIAHGGSLIFSASMLAMLDYCEAVEQGKSLDPQASKRRVLGIDIDIRQHNRDAIEAHPMSHMIEMIQGSSIDQEIVTKVREFAKGYKRVLVCLDSNHTHDHVLAELEAYADLVSVNSYCIVLDTLIDDMPADMMQNRSWGPGNSPKSAVHEYLKSNSNFEIDKKIDYKLLISVAPDGYLKRVK
jgi:cephalosporin hydroxylase